MARQFVVQLPNRPGELAHLARALAARGVNIEHVSCVGAGTVSCAFLTTAADDTTRRVLVGMGASFIEGETIVVDVPDRPGGLADVTGLLAAADVNILGALIVGRRDGIVEMAFAVDDPVRARDALVDALVTA
jgi:hypothetical protein